jgi:hypothetical protein
MASSRPKRPKGPPPRLNLEEMEQDPSMRGMLSFLEVSPGEKLEMLRRRSEVDATSVIPFPAPPSAAAPNIGAPELRGPEVGGAPPAAPKHGALEIGAPSFSAPKFNAPILDAPEVMDGKGPDVGKSMAPKLGAATFGAPELQDVYVYRPNRPTARPASTAQDGHTHGEQALFATLWRLARQSSQGTFRVISIGERTLASEVPMAYSTVQENLRSLAAKLAIEVRTNGPRQPKAYIVYPYEEILRRRRAAGLTHVIRRTSGVTLVRPDSVNSGAPNVGASSFSSGATSSGAPELPSGAPSFTTSGAPSLGALIKNEEITPGTSSPQEWPLAVQALLAAMGHGDDDAIRLMAQAAIQNAPDATDEELAYFIRDEAPRVIRNRALDNPMGMLIRQVPRRFVGASLRIVREEIRRRKEAEAALERERLLEARRILADPASPENEKQWARMLLETEESPNKPDERSPG